MNKKAIIIGEHKIAGDISRQYERAGYDVLHSTVSEAVEHPYSDTAEIVLLAKEGADDNHQLRTLSELAKKPEYKDCKVHLMLNSNAALTLLRRNGLADAIADNLEVNAFTIADEWARKIRLDHKPITLLSEQRPHLVIFGANERVRQIAINAALKSHFPNYTRDTKLRTRITIIDSDIEKFADRLISTYRYLFDNSYYRKVDCEDACAVTERHQPIYAGQREDFVDVEWEFVKASIFNRTVTDKLTLWANDPKQQLTIAIAQGNDADNISLAMHLPKSVIDNGTPLYVWLTDSAVIDSIAPTYNMRAIIPIGMENCGYDITTPLVEMGKNVNYVYNQCYNDNMATEKSSEYDMPVFSIAIDKKERQLQWRKLSMVKQMSSIYNAMTIETKLRSVGLDTDEIAKFHDLSAREINLLAEVEHNRWSVEELILGYRPCTDDELKEINADLGLKRKYRDKMVHYDLRSYRDLRNDITGKNVNIYDICLSGSLPIIYKSPPA